MENDAGLMLSQPGGKILHQANDLTLLMPSNEEELLAQTGNSMEIEYFPPFDGSIFSEDVYGETNELGMPTHELPDILPVCALRVLVTSPAARTSYWWATGAKPSL